MKIKRALTSEEQKIYDLKLEVAPLFGSKCFICELPIKAKKPTFVYHHIVYVLGELIHSNFKKPNGKPDTLAYHQYLIPIIKEHPERFALLCNNHHQSLERLKRFKKDKLERLIDLVKRSI